MQDEVHSPAPSPAPDQAAAVRRHPWITVLVSLVVLALLWTGLLGWWLPGWMRPRVEAAASQSLGTPVRVGRLAVQPWTLEITADDIAVGARRSELLTVQRVQAQLSLGSLWRLAPVLRRVTVTRPQLWVERQQADRFNFTPILEHLAARRTPEAPDAPPARFAVYNIRLVDGLVRYGDKVLGQAHRAEAINIGVPFLSSLPADEDVNVQPLLEARLDGSPLRVDGRALPFKEGLHSELDIHWRDVDLAKWSAAARPLLPPELQVDVARGRLAASLKIVFEQRKAPAVPRVSITGGMDIADLDVQLPAQGLQARWTSLKVAGIDSLPLERQARLGSVMLDGARVALRPVTIRQSAGVRPSVSQPATTPVAGLQAGKPQAAPAQTAWRWQLDQLRLQAQAVDIQPAGADALPTLGPIHLSLAGLSSRPNAPPARLRFEAADPHGMALGVKGDLQADPPRATLDVTLAGLQAAPWLKALGHLVPVPLRGARGELALQTRVLADAQSLSLDQGRVGLTKVLLQAGPPEAKDEVSLADAQAQGLQARVRLPAQGRPASLENLGLSMLAISKLDIRATRDAQGHWPLLPHAGTGKSTGSTAATPASTTAIAPLPILALAELRCTQCAMAITDQAVQPAASVKLSQTSLTVRRASSDLSRPVAFELDTRAQGKGQIRLSGEVRPQPLSLKGRLGITALDLRVLQPYIGPHVNIALAQALANADGRFSAALPESGDTDRLEARYQGRAALREVRVQDSVNQADFLRWKALSADGLDVAWRNRAIDADLGRIALQDFYGRLIINPNGRLNLADITDRGTGQAAKSLTTPQNAPSTSKAPEPATGSASGPIAPKVETAAAAASAQTSSAPGTTSATVPTATAASAPPPQLRWQHITLAKGRVDFTDNFVKPNYSARLTRVEGDVSAVASSKPAPANVKISGAVDDGASLEITGQLHPLGPRLFTDLQGTAKGIELTRLSPYAGRYAGYAIEKGTLSLTVHYKVDNGRLEAQNQIFLDQLTFGDKVDSPDATKLPVQLAISLLKNSRGEIDISLPVSGSLDDPQFSVGGLVWKVIVNLLSKAITAPFSLLMGGDSNELGSVPFDAGSAELGDTARQRLDALAARLKDKPSLKLEATGRADPAVDAEGLKERHVRALMRAAKARATGQPLSEVRIADEERGQWLAAAYKAADIKKPRNLIGLAKSLPPAEMEALLKAGAPADSVALKVLADRRGDRVKAYLADKLPPERVQLTASKLGREGLPADDHDTPARVQFAIH